MFSKLVLDLFDIFLDCVYHFGGSVGGSLLGPLGNSPRLFNGRSSNLLGSLGNSLSSDLSLFDSVGGSLLGPLGNSLCLFDGGASSFLGLLRGCLSGICSFRGNFCCLRSSCFGVCCDG